MKRNISVCVAFVLLSGVALKADSKNIESKSALDSINLNNAKILESKSKDSIELASLESKMKLDSINLDSNNAKTESKPQDSINLALLDSANLDSKITINIESKSKDSNITESSTKDSIKHAALNATKDSANTQSAQYKSKDSIEESTTIIESKSKDSIELASLESKMKLDSINLDSNNAKTESNAQDSINLALLDSKTATNIESKSKVSNITESSTKDSITLAELETQETQERTQETPQESPLSKSSKTKILNKVVTTATGFQTSLIEEQRNVQIVDKSDIQDKGYTSVVDALQNTQITFTYNGFNSPNIDMRGQGAASPRAVKVLQNGVALNLIDSPFAYNRTPFDIMDVNNIEQIEIIPGGGAVLYGNGTRGGVVNIITKKSSRNDFYSFLLGSTFNGLDSKNDWYGISPNFTAQSGTKISDNLYLSLSARGFFNHGYRQGEYNRGYNLASNFIFDLSEKQSLSLDFNFTQSWMKMASGLTSTQLNENRRQYSDGGSQNNFMKINTLISLNYNYKILENLILDATAYYTYDNNELLGTQGHFFDNKAGLNTKAKWDYNWFNGQLIGGYEFMWANGSRRTYQNVDSGPQTMPAPPNMTIRVLQVVDNKNDPTKISNAFFILNRNTWTEWLDTSLGFRLENTTYKLNRSAYSQTTTIRTTNGNSVVTNGTPVTNSQNPVSNFTNFALEIMPNFKYSDTGNAYVKYERGYISPSPSELTNGIGTSANRQYTDSGVKPETYDTFEIGAKDYLLDSIYLSGALYYTQTYDEILLTGGFMSANGWRYSNLDRTGRFGVELNAKEDFFTWLHLNQSISYTYSQIQQGANAGNRIPLVPDYKIALGFSFDVFDFGKQKLNLFVNTIFYGAQTMPLSTNAGTTYQKQKGYNLTDLGLTYTFSGFSLSGGVRNLFDTEYNFLTYMSGTTQLYLPAPGRTYYAELRYKL